MIYKTIQQQVQPRMLAILMVSLITMTLLSGYLYVLKAPIKAFTQTKQALDLLENEMQTGIPLENQITVFQQLIKELTLKLHGTSPTLPANQMIAFVIGQLDQIAEQHDIKLVSIQPEQTKSILTFTELPFRVELKGSYFNFYDWLYQIEQELGPIVIKQFEIKAANNSEQRHISLIIASYQFIE